MINSIVKNIFFVKRMFLLTNSIAIKPIIVKHNNPTIKAIIGFNIIFLFTSFHIFYEHFLVKYVLNILC